MQPHPPAADSSDLGVQVGLAGGLPVTPWLHYIGLCHAAAVGLRGQEPPMIAFFQAQSCLVVWYENNAGCEIT